MQLKKINFLEGVFDDRSDDSESGFDTNVTLATGELQKLIPALIAALGGELQLGAPAATDAAIVNPARARREAVTASGDDGDPPF
jgi:recombination associated protein RdgC